MKLMYWQKSLSSPLHTVSIQSIDCSFSTTPGSELKGYNLCSSIRKHSSFSFW